MYDQITDKETATTT